MHFLLKKFNIDHPSEVVGMPGFTQWTRDATPRQRNGKPLPNGRSWREQTDPWRKISRTAFGLDYLKAYQTKPPRKRGRRGSLTSEKPNEAKLLHLNAYDDSQRPFGFDVNVQRIGVYIQRKLGDHEFVRTPSQGHIVKPYKTQDEIGNNDASERDRHKVDIEPLDNSNTVILFDLSASLILEDCLVQPRSDEE